MARARLSMALEIRRLIRDMSLANPLWGAPRIHGELLKLGIAIGQTSVAKYMARRRGPPSPGWRRFLRNHADGIAAMDLFLVPTISFRLLYGLLILRHERRRLLWLGATTHPTEEWIAQQLTEACGWDEAPRYLVRDRDQSYGEVFVRRVRAMGSGDDCNHRAANCPAASAARAGASVFGGVGHGIKSTSHASQGRRGALFPRRPGPPRAVGSPTHQRLRQAV